MKSFINIFLTLVMPISILLTAVATVYYSTSFIFSKAIRLGTIAGVLTGISVAFILALIISIIRAIHAYRQKSKILSPGISAVPVNIVPNPTIYEKKSQAVQKSSIATKKHKESDTIEENFMLLMNKELAYEVSLNTINQGQIGDIIHENKEDGSILLRSHGEEIHIQIKSLTRHTAEVHILSTIDNSSMRNIITTLKEKEHSFIQY